MKFASFLFSCSCDDSAVACVVVLLAGLEPPDLARATTSTLHHFQIVSLAAH